MTRPTRFDWLFRPRMADEDLPLSAEARFAEALAELPAVERSALALSEIGGLDTEEIAERLGTDPAVVQRLLARARRSVRASLSARRGLAAVLPFPSLWQLGSSGSAARAAGVVAAAVVGPTVMVGGVASEAPRAGVFAADPPAVRAIEETGRSALSAPRVVIGAIRPVLAATPSERAAATRHRPTRPSVSPPSGRAAAAVPRRRPLRQVPEAPAAQPERPTTPAERNPEQAPEQVPEQVPEQGPEQAREQPRANAGAATAPTPLPEPPAVELPVVPPPPVVPAPELPPPPEAPVPLP